MLVLTRGVGQEIVIGGIIRVTVLGTERNKLRLGIDAPPDLRIDRLEVHNRRVEEDAGDSSPEPSESAVAHA